MTRSSNVHPKSNRVISCKGSGSGRVSDCVTVAQQAVYAKAIQQDINNVSHS